MKYIDAGRLQAFLQKKLESYKSKMVDPSKYPIDHIDLMALLAREYQSLILQLESFLQEQPKPSGYDKALLEVKSKVDELYDEASIGLNEYDSGLYNGIAETCMKLRGFIKARLGSDEQLEVDLEKEIDDYIAFNFSEAADGILLSDANGTELQITDVSQIARHFYKLGLNARKKD